MSAGSSGRRQPAPLVALPRRSPLAVLVAAQRGRAPVAFFDARATLAAMLEAAAQQLGAACYAVDAYSSHTGEKVEVADEVRRSVTVLSRLSSELAAPPRVSTGAGPASSGKSQSVDRGGDDDGAGHG